MVRYYSPGAAGAVGAVGGAGAVVLGLCLAQLLVQNRRDDRRCPETSCPADRPICLLGRCIECAGSADCKATGRCDVATNRCAACVEGTPTAPSAAPCPGGTKCVAGACVAGAAGAGAAVSAAAMQRCTGDADCPALAPICNMTTMQCGQCAHDADCTSDSSAKCDKVVGRCVPCDLDAVCASHGVKQSCLAGTCVDGTVPGVSNRTVGAGMSPMGLRVGVGVGAVVVVVCVALAVWMGVRATRLKRLTRAAAGMPATSSRHDAPAPGRPVAGK
jgi:hypothetical protein